jgi:tRNA(Ile)-lysidine synthase
VRFFPGLATMDPGNKESNQGGIQGNPHNRMNSKLQQRVLETIDRHSMIRPGDRVGMGVSGGADSVALLHLLAGLRSELGIRVLVLHFHHQLRGMEADEDEQFVKMLASEFQLEFVSGRGDVAGEANRQGWNLEDAARRMRYEFFASAAASQNLDRVAVAHSADDQAETVLAHLLRGTGPAGLAGIYPVAGLTVRPLLEIGRGELRGYLSGLGRTWREDATNQDTSRLRARIRHRLLPLLLRDFEPLSVTRLARLASLAREDETFWRSLEEERFRALAFAEPSGGVSIKIMDLLSPLPSLACGDRKAKSDFDSPDAPALALTRRLVRRIVAGLRGSRQQVTARHVQDVLDLATKSQSGARIELPGVTVERAFDRLRFCAALQREEAGEIDETVVPGHGFEYAISEPGPSEMSSIVVPEIRRRFSLKLVDWPPLPGQTVECGHDAGIICRDVIDFDRLQWPLVLRSWRPGDSYRPHGHRSVQKLKRLFLESRVPRSSRASWPVLTSAGQLVWASGYPVAGDFAPHSATRTGIVVGEQELQDADAIVLGGAKS